MEYINPNLFCKNEEKLNLDRMKLNKQEFVRKVNEIYHDVEGEIYLQKHPEIFVDEVNRWKKIAKKYFIKNFPITILDIGSGTGFVPLVIAPFLKKDDMIICSDLSSVMLDVCRREIAKRQFKCKFRFVKSKGNTVRIVENIVDFITINSVLHHILNVGEFFSQIGDIISEEGILVIAHEPNKAFYNNRFLWNNYILLRQSMNVKNMAISILKKIGLLSFVKILLGHKSTITNSSFKNNIDIVDRVNNRLLKQGLIKAPLTKSEIGSIIDIHSPTAGAFYKERCFNFNKLLKENLNNFKIVKFETYNHCCKMTSKNLITKIYANFLKVIFPKKGATFLAVLKKISKKSLSNSKHSKQPPWVVINIRKILTILKHKIKKHSSQKKLKDTSIFIEQLKNINAAVLWK